ncbi:hypothetical protein PRIPAC_82442, partial [Pristionchus pacificus]|uniref:Uncharacterized protein n=1 Tax=Pristionchus pacificus TaxID=54126 RepID=A0A2A6BWI4_PRIPA
MSGPGWSPIELLPSELMWSIIDMCLKLMYPMRLTSKANDARVHEYALLKAEVAESVAFVSTYEPISTSEMEKVLRLEITFSPMKKQWFNLRYRLPPDHLTKGVSQYGVRELKEEYQQYLLG